MELIPTTPTVLPSAAVQIAKSEIDRLNAMLGSRVADHRERYLAFWDNPSATPDEILSALGTDARRYLDAASESVAHLARLAALAGLTLGEILPPEYYIPRRAFVFGEDGTITLEPAPEPPPVEPAPEPAPVSSGALSADTATIDASTGVLTFGGGLTPVLPQPTDPAILTF